MPDEHPHRATLDPRRRVATPPPRPVLSRPSSPALLARDMDAEHEPEPEPDERTSLLDHSRAQLASSTTPSPTLSYRTPPHPLTRQHSTLSHRTSRSRSHAAHAYRSHPGARTEPGHSLESSSILPPPTARLWYDQFTTIDWLHDYISDAERQKQYASLPGLRGRARFAWHSAQSWLVAALIGVLVAVMAYLIDVVEPWLFDLKFGYCRTAWWRPKRFCCASALECEPWRSWGEVLRLPDAHRGLVEWAIYLAFTVALASLACNLAMRVRLRVPSDLPAMRMDDDLVSFQTLWKSDKPPDDGARPPHTLTYPATGSGVAEVRVILSGFVLHGYLGTATLCVKGLSLILSVAAGLSVGKEGPFVHMACAIANVVARLSPKFKDNNARRREMLSAGAASGVAVAFGAPISGVLFALEEVSYYFPSKTLFRTFFASIVAAVSLKFLNPYGTSKIVLFQVHYTRDWHAFELALFLLLGILGGALGATFIKATRLWARTFRSLRIVKASPLAEVALIALLTGLTTWGNRYTRKPVAELMFELSSDCRKQRELNTGLCPLRDDIPAELAHLAVAFLIKAVLTTVTFGLKVPAGIYIPSMVLGGLLGRLVGHSTQYAIMTLFRGAHLFGSCATTGEPEACVVPGVYALVAAAATMCGVTRLTITIAVIMFELSGSLDHVLPFSIAVLAAKWTADALEPLSIYDLLTETNDYPFLDNKTRPTTLTGTLADITPRASPRRAIDVSDGPVVRASALRDTIARMHEAGEPDGALPVLRDAVLVGLVPAPALECALDGLPDDDDDDDEIECVIVGAGDAGRRVDLRGLVDPAPIALDRAASVELAYEAFVKLGLRYVCVLHHARYYGMLHKKAFVRHVRQAA